MRLISSIVRMALQTLRENKVRSFLTVLGVVIGTGAIIGVGSIMAGIDNSIASLIGRAGANSIMVFKTTLGPRTSDLSPEEKQRKPLTYEDALALVERCPAVDHVSAYLLFTNFRRSPSARFKNEIAYRLQVAGTDEFYVSSGQAEISSGRFFSDAENDHKSPVAVIGKDVYGSLFGKESAIGKKILLDGHELEVLGVMAAPTSVLPGQSDNRVILPYFTMKKMFPQANENLLFVQPKPGQMAAAIDELTAVLRQRRRVGLSAPNSFEVTTAAQMVTQFRQLTAVVGSVLVILSSIGLLVGGIGVMNIMLVSVTERTREIGLRKALGARRSDIVAQFLTEAVVLTGIGGLLGMLLGWLVSWATHLAVPSLQTLVPLWAVAAGIVVSVGIGLFFGIWPASKAARMDPVEALRYE